MAAAEQLLVAVAAGRVEAVAERDAYADLFAFHAGLPLCLTLRSLHGDPRALARHSAGVAVTAMALVTRTRLSGRVSARQVFEGALFHDIGKLEIPDAILSKPSPLTDAESDRMRDHVTIGHRILLRCPGIAPEVAEVALRHHEYIDGSGYPDGIGGDSLSPLVRLVTVADIFTALTEPRAYREAQSGADAVLALRSMGGKVDPSLVDALAAIVEAT
ncbi:HD domain-containing phosphohydrolase [Chthonobacter albigriseus]|uniref:HD domain-containing phosphohydrolase n=1 Tax=Chthonobacter albigriseus TaxID=1683161 RepID=UPI0015EF81BA